MKIAGVSLALVASASAYRAPMTMMAAKKAPKASKGGMSASAVAWANSVPSEALPFARAPGTLDGSMLGDAGFDPLGFSTISVGPWFAGLIDGGQGIPGDLTWFREAELIHGRIAQLAWLGFIAPGLFGTFPGNEWTGVDAYSNTNPLEAFDQVPGLALLQIFIFMSLLEFRRLGIIREEGANYVAGDSRIGQGPKGYNPFGFNYSPEEFAIKQEQELNHCRVAMVGVFGVWAQTLASGMGPVDQLKLALSSPDYFTKAGYFLPEGI